jgi:hypothetical protein
MTKAFPNSGIILYDENHFLFHLLAILVSRLRNNLINLAATFYQNLVHMLPIDPVIPAKAGIQSFDWLLDSGFRRSDIVLH